MSGQGCRDISLNAPKRKPGGWASECKRDSPEVATHLGLGALSPWDHFWAPDLLLVCRLSPTDPGVLREGPLGQVSWSYTPWVDHAGWRGSGSSHRDSWSRDNCRHGLEGQNVCPGAGGLLSGRWPALALAVLAPDSALPQEDSPSCCGDSPPGTAPWDPALQRRREQPFLVVWRGVACCSSLAFPRPSVTCSTFHVLIGHPWIFFGPVSIQVYVGQLCVTVTEHLRKSTERSKGLFWLTISEASVHGHLAPLL